jgi:hypothetical protein
MSSSNIHWNEILTDSVRYWEVRRIAYNACLAVNTVVAYLSNQSKFVVKIDFGACVFLLIMAVIANLLYTAAYVPDVVMKLTIYREIWQRYRWVLFVFGTLFASLLAWMMVAPQIMM